MKIDLNEVDRVARLARLEVSAGEAPRLAAQMNRILAYMDQLSELDTTGLEPLAHPLTLSTPYRADEIGPSLPPEEALALAPERDGPFIVVPRVI